MILQWFGSEHQNGDSIISVFWRLWAAICQNILQFSRQTLKAAVKEIWKTKMSFKFLREDDATQKRAMNLKKSWKKMVSTLALTFWNVKTLEISLKGKISVKILVKNRVFLRKNFFLKSSVKQLLYNWTLNWRNFGNSMIFLSFDSGTCFDVKILVGIWKLLSYKTIIGNLASDQFFIFYRQLLLSKLCKFFIHAKSIF